jgi:hypothetical protein
VDRENWTENLGQRGLKTRKTGERGTGAGRTGDREKLISDEYED